MDPEPLTGSGLFRLGPRGRHPSASCQYLPRCHKKEKNTTVLLRVCLLCPFHEPREPRPAQEPGQHRAEPPLWGDEDGMARPDPHSVLTLVQISPSGQHRNPAGRHGPSA